MKQRDLEQKSSPQDQKGSERYEAPTIRVFTEAEIVAQLGPAQLYTGALPFQF
jgi:hypothetical protein